MKKLILILIISLFIISCNHDTTEDETPFWPEAIISIDGGESIKFEVGMISSEGGYKTIYDFKNDLDMFYYVSFENGKNKDGIAEVEIVYKKNGKRYGQKSITYNENLIQGIPEDIVFSFEGRFCTKEEPNECLDIEGDVYFYNRWFYHPII